MHGEQRRPKGDRQVPEGGGGSAVTLSPDVGPAAGEGDDGALTGRGSLSLLRLLGSPADEDDLVVEQVQLVTSFVSAACAHER